MENLSKITKIFFVLFTFFFVVQDAISQQDFFVYKLNGEPYFKVNDSVKSITKGSSISRNTLVVMNKNDKLSFINDKGDIFELSKIGKYSYNDLQKIPAIKDNTTLTRKFGTYLLKELTNNITTRNDKSGVVYRGDDIVLMRYPTDSIKIYYSEIKFEWDSIKDKTKEYFFILKDLDTDKTIKIGTLATSISLFVDGSILKEAGNYKWAITETKYPNYNKTIFYHFKVLNKSEFEALEKEINEISIFLKDLGLSKNEIRTTICQGYKICY